MLIGTEGTPAQASAWSANQHTINNKLHWVSGTNRHGGWHPLFQRKKFID
jgi:hypothetical protein